MACPRPQVFCFQTQYFCLYTTSHNVKEKIKTDHKKTEKLKTELLKALHRRGITLNKSLNNNSKQNNNNNKC
jgi:hypothetical protein